MTEKYPWEEYEDRLPPWIPEDWNEDPFARLNESFDENTCITKIGVIEDWEGYNRICDESLIDSCTEDTTSIEEFKSLPFIFLKDTTKYEAFTVYKGRVWSLKDKTLQKRDISHFSELENERNLLLERYASTEWRWGEPLERPEIFGDMTNYPKFIRSLMQVPPYTDGLGTTWSEPVKDPFVRVVDNEEGMDEKINFNPYSTSTPYYLGGLFTFFLRRVILPRELEIKRKHYPRFFISPKNFTSFNFLCFLPQSLVLLNKYMNATVLSEFSFHGFYDKEVDIERYFWSVREMKEDQKKLWVWFNRFKNFYNSLRADENINSFFSLESLLNEASLLNLGFESIFKERKEVWNTQQIKLITYREEKNKNEEEDRRFEELLKRCAENKKTNPEKFKEAVRKYADLFKGIFTKE